MSEFHGMYRGICTSNADPEGLNRIKAVVPQVFGNGTTESGWAWPCQPPQVIQETPIPNQGVWIAFEGGDVDYPIWMGVWNADDATLGYSAQSEGAKFDGMTDDTAAIQAVINNLPPSGGEITCPPATAVVNGTLTINRPVTFTGQGSGMDWNNVLDAPWKPSTQFLRTAGTSAVFSVTGPTGAVRFNGIGIDCSNLAVSGITGDQWQGGGGADLAIRRSTGYALDLGTTSGSANINTMGLVFDGIYLRGNGLVRMTGNAGHTSNCTHNTFVRLIGSFSGTDALHLTDADNNDFFGTFLFCEAGVGSNYGVYFDTYARGNYFYHLEPGINGVFASTPSTLTFSNTIFGYDRNNGQAAPTLASNPGHLQLTWTEDGLNASAWNAVTLYQTTLKETSGGSSTQAVRLFDTNTGKSSYIRGFSGSGGIEFLNNAFAAVTATLSDAGTLGTANGIQPGNFGTLQTGGNIWMGTGVPSNANGNNGDFFFRTDGSLGSLIYFKSGGTWSAVV